MNKYYYGFEYWDGVSTTTGQPNGATGRMSIAGEIVAFRTKSDRTDWLNGQCNSYGGRISCTKKDLRSLCLGESMDEFEEMIDNAQFNCDEM